MILQNWWFTTLMGVKSPMAPPLRGEKKTDVVVIGGGTAGLSAALRLSQAGVKTVLLESNVCGGSTTGKSAGFLTPDSELELHQILRRFGVEAAKRLWAVPCRGVDIIRGAVKRYDFDCDLVEQDCLYLSKTKRQWLDVQNEHKTRTELGLQSELYDAERLPQAMGSQGFSGGVRYSGTYTLNPLLYSQGVKRGLLDDGVMIHEASRVNKIEGHTVYTDLGSVTADEIILCADKTTSSLTSYSWNVYHAQTFLAVSEPLSQKDIERLFPTGTLQCWDSDLIYSYWRLTADGRLLLGGGSLLTAFARKDVTTPSVIESVIARWRRHYPDMDHIQFIQYWPGRIDMTRDLLPTIVRDRKYQWIHHVMGCVGLPWASFCGDFCARHVLNKERESDKYYYRYFSPKRGFLIPLWVEKIVGKQLMFSMNTAWAKFHQNDKGETVDVGKEDF